MQTLNKEGEYGIVNGKYIPINEITDFREISAIVEITLITEKEIITNYGSKRT